MGEESKSSALKLPASEHGFTLVELSIVLVVIGLLIGGIVAAQSMINSAKINAQIKQFSQIDSAVTNFQTKYIYMPGDSPLHSSAGDGDGALENSVLNGGGTTSTTSAFDYEIANFWRHLQQDGFLTNEYSTFSNNAASGVRTGTHVPKAILGDGKTGVAPCYDNWTGNMNNPQSEYYLANFEGSTTSNIFQGSAGGVATINVADMAAIDTKIDDSYAFPSNWATYSAGNINTSSVSPSCYTASGTVYKYNIASAAKCILYVRMKTTNGLK